MVERGEGAIDGEGLLKEALENVKTMHINAYENTER